MILEAISLTLACGCWAIGIILALAMLIEHGNVKDDIKWAIFSLIFFGFIGAMFGLPSFVSPVKDLKYSYTSPTHIIRTNDVTHVIYVGENGLISRAYTDAKYWNATNIEVRIHEGKNIWGVNVGKFYNIGIWEKGTYGEKE